MRNRSLRRACESYIRDLDISIPFNVHDLCQQVEEARGRRLRLVAAPMSIDGPCGLLVSTATADYIFYEPYTSGLHRDHIILHEIGHLLCEHVGSQVLNDHTLSTVFRHLDPTTPQRMLGRSHYSAEEERLAEMFATIVLTDANRWTPPPPERAESDPAGLLDRLGSSLYHPNRRNKDA